MPDPNIVVLTDGTLVEFYPEFTHEAEILRREKMYENVMLVPDGEGGFTTEGLPMKSYIASTEVCIPVLIKRIEKDNIEIPYSDTWLRKLSQKSFMALKRKVDEMIMKSSMEEEEAKKKGS